MLQNHWKQGNLGFQIFYLCESHWGVRSVKEYKLYMLLSILTIFFLRFIIIKYKHVYVMFQKAAAVQTIALPEGPIHLQRTT